MDLQTLLHKAAYGNRGLTLESLDDDLPEGGDAELGSFAESADAHGEYCEELNLAAEAIRDYGDQLAALIKAKELTPVTLALIRQGAQSHAARVGYDIALPAMESVEVVDIEAQGKIALEGFRNVINNLFQDFVVHFKHQKDVVTDFFRTTSGMIAKYERKTIDNKNEWNEKKANLENDDIRVSFQGFSYFLLTKTSNDEYKFADFVGSLRQDRAASSFMLKEYPKRVIAEMNALTKLVRGASLNSIDDVFKLGRAVEKLKTPAELFDKKYLETELFGMATIDAPKTSKGRVHNDKAGKGFDRLAELASSKPVTVRKSGVLKLHNAVVGGVSTFLGRAAITAGAQAIGAVAAGAVGAARLGGAVAAPLHYAALGVTAGHAIHAGVGGERGNIVVRTTDIGTIFDGAEAYLADARQFLALERDVLRAIEELEGTVKALEEKNSREDNGDEVTHDSYMDAISVYEQVLAYSRTLSRAMQSPGTTEVARSLRASKYLNYLGLRAIFNAKSK